MIRPVILHDAERLCTIYNFYITQTIITFEEHTVDAEEMTARILELTQTHPWLVYEELGVVIGFAYASPWKSRCAYRFSAESTVYLLSLIHI